MVIALDLPEAAANRLERAIRDLENILRVRRAIALAHSNEKASEGKSAVGHTETKFGILFDCAWRTERAWYLIS